MSTIQQAIEEIAPRIQKKFEVDLDAERDYDVFVDMVIDELMNKRLIFTDPEIQQAIDLIGDWAEKQP